MEIQDFPNYLIYDDGKLWSKSKNDYKAFNLVKGYNCVILYNNGKKKPYKIHRLVAEYYIPNPNNYKTVDHIDQNKLNNNVSNLRWANSEMQNNNRTISCSKPNTNNKSGHKYIYYLKCRNCWTFQHKKIKGIRCFKNKTDALCYKFIMLLKYKLH